MALGIFLIVIVAIGLGWWAGRARDQGVALAAKDRPQPVEHERREDTQVHDDEVARAEIKAKLWWPPASLERQLVPDLLRVALWLGWWIGRAGVQGRAVAVITTHRPYAVRYEGQEYPDPFEDEAAKAKPKPWWPPEFLERRLGPDPFRDAVEVDLDRSMMPGAPDEDELIAAVLRLRRLKVLRVEFDVDDRRVEQLARLPALEDLSIPNSNGGLTDAGMRTIGTMKTLKHLHVNHTAVTPAGLAALDGLTRLESLHTANMTFVQDGTGRMVRPAPTTDWSPGIAPFSKLSHLIVLDLGLPTISGAGLEDLGRIKSLKMLEIEGLSCAEGDLRHLATLTKLQVLGLSGMALDGTGFRHLGGLTQLRWVILKDAPRLADAAIPGLASLPALESAMLDGSHLTAEGLMAFRAAPQLGFLQVDPAVADQDGRLQQALPKCRVENGRSGTAGAIGYAIDLK